MKWVPLFSIANEKIAALFSIQFNRDRVICIGNNSLKNLLSTFAEIKYKTPTTYQGYTPVTAQNW